jgi:hypothetical protein
MKNGLQIDEDGNKQWYKDDTLHREDGPACEWVNGDKYWYLDGKEHRIDGPAIEFAESHVYYWYNNGLKHREDGPACIYDDGYMEWWLNGDTIYSEKVNNLHNYPNLSESFKQSIIKYQLTL